jgi:general secretion pathway protein G
MIAVITVMGILAAIAVPIYQAQMRASKEAVLKNNLAVIRERLDQYKADRGDYPTSLDELVERGYFREIPEDPIAGVNLWEEVYEEYDPDDPEAEPGVFDVRSTSTEIGTDGVPYYEW